MAPPRFDITPEKEATKLQYFYRQFFVKTSALTKDDVDLEGKTAIITGANTGLGLETARQLLDLGLSKLIIAARDLSKADNARKQLHLGRAPGSCHIDVWGIDLSSYESVVSFAERAATLERLDLVILNAALYKVLETFNTSTGYEEDIQVNYLSNVLLSVLLLPILSKKKEGSPPGRLILLSSDAAAWAQWEERSSRPLLAAFKQGRESWNMHERYATSKLLGQLFLNELAKRVPASAVTIGATNPGFCHGSELGREGKGSFAGFVFIIFSRLVGKPCWMGARSVLHAAAGFGHEVHGQYVEDGLLRPMAPLVYSPEGEELSKMLWEETMAELSFARTQQIVDGMEGDQ